MARTIDGKSIFIFGAGASLHAGAPLLRDFMEVAEQLSLRRDESLVFRDSFEKVFRWVNQFRQSYARSPIGYGNLESIYSLLHTACETGDPLAIKTKEDLTHLIFETLDRSILLQPIGGGGFGDPVYNRFLTNLIQLNSKRRQRIHDHAYSSDVLVSFNYDVLLDLAFYQHRLPVDYALGQNTPQLGSIPLLKLHGSMNWVKHADCRFASQNSTEVQLLGFDGGQALLERGDRDARFWGYRHLRDTKCTNPGCNYSGVLAPVFVPPTWSKSPVQAGIPEVWNRAVSELESAEQIVVIGYSMPPTDTFFQYLIALGMRKNLKLKRVVIVNPDNSPDFIKRYREIFAQDVQVSQHVAQFRDFAEDSNFEWLLSSV